MSFLHPEFLYYMLPPLFILFGFLLTQKTQQESFFSQEVMDKLRVSANTLTLKARNAIFLLIGILMVFALSGPVIDEGKVEIKAKSADIMIGLDISDSMLGEDVYPNRLKFAKQKALSLLKEAPTERVGIIAFAQNSYLVSPLSFDSSAVGFLLRSLDTTSITEKGTNFLTMLEVVQNSIDTKTNKYLLVLSDGGDSRDFSKEIAYAKEHNIVVFVLGVGTTKGAPIKMQNGEFIKSNGEIMISKLNENIQDLATSTGGVYIKSINSNDDIKTMMHEMEKISDKKELKSQVINKFIPLFYYPLGLALFLLLIATSSMSKRVNVKVPMLFVLGMFLTLASPTKAALLDFAELDKAKEAYKSGEFEKSQKIYEEYQKNRDKKDVNYNIGNSFYKQGKYKEAIQAYKKAEFKDAASYAKNYANLGNSYVKTGDEKELEKAVSAYEESLKLKDDKAVRENLEAVKEFIKKKKEQKQKQKDQQKKDKQKKDKNKEDKQKDDKKKNDDKKSDKDNKSDDKSDKKEDKKQKNKSDEKEKNSEDKKSEKEKKKEQQQNKKEDETKELKDDNASSQTPQTPKQLQDKMSDKEEKKWLKMINKQQNTFLYQLNKETKIEENSNAKPW